MRQVERIMPIVMWLWLCDYNDAYMFVKGTITVENTANTDVCGNNVNKKIILNNNIKIILNNNIN